MSYQLKKLPQLVRIQILLFSISRSSSHSDIILWYRSLWVRSTWRKLWRVISLRKLVSSFSSEDALHLIALIHSILFARCLFNVRPKERFSKFLDLQYVGWDFHLGVLVYPLMQNVFLRPQLRMPSWMMRLTDSFWQIFLLLKSSEMGPFLYHSTQ